MGVLGEMELTTNMYGVPLRGKGVLKLGYDNSFTILCKYTKKQSWGSCMIYELYLNNAVFKTESKKESWDDYVNVR